MAKKKPGPPKKAGRPTIEIDWAKLDKVCQYAISLEDAAYFAGCGVRTLTEKIRDKYDMDFRQFREQRMAVTKLNLRSKQVELALKGNVGMLVWLGKNMLGQSDKAEVKTENSHKHIGSYEEFIIARNKERKKLDAQKQIENKKTIEDAVVIPYDKKKTNEGIK